MKMAATGKISPHRTAATQTGQDYIPERRLRWQLCV
jgi:hypothetical protein